MAHMDTMETPGVQKKELCKKCGAGKIYYPDLQKRICPYCGPEIFDLADEDDSYLRDMALGKG